MKFTATSLLEKYWLDQLGCGPDDLEEGKVKVFSHGALAGYSGAIALKKNNSCIISAPQPLVSVLSKKVANMDCQSVFNPTSLEKLFEGSVERTIGPAWQGEVDTKTFISCHGADSRELAKDDWPDFEHFLRGCAVSDVDFSALESGRMPTVGVFIDEEIVAAASYNISEGIIAAIGILTHPAHRGNGYAKRAVSHITRIALDKNLGIQYQTLISNTHSVFLAKELGFTDFAETISVRLKNN